jgi:hypothetical protein
MNSNEKLRSPGGGGNPTSDRINRAADVGADLGLLFPRNPAEAEKAPNL